MNHPGRLFKVYRRWRVISANTSGGMRTLSVTQDYRQRSRRAPERSPGVVPRAPCLATVDPLVCTRCGQKMQPIAFLTDQLSIRRILDHLGLGTSAQDKPPPAREILRVAEQGQGWGVPANWE